MKISIFDEKTSLALERKSAICSLFSPTSVVSIICTLFLFLPSQSKAGAIAYARNTITNVRLTTGIANNFTNNGVTTNSQDFADLDSEAGGSVSDSQNLDPLFAARGANSVAAAENTFVLLGPHIAKADAVISNNLLNARGDALVNLNKTDVGNAFSTNTLDIIFTLAQADTITLAFTDAALLQASLHPNAQANSQALARMVVDIDITERFGNFDMIFQWKPDGAGTVTGGVSNADPFSLNNELNEVNAGGKQIYNKAAANFSATTNMFAAGQYRLNFFMSQTAFAEDIKAVPEPSTLSLLALGGLAVLAASRQRVRVLASPAVKPRTIMRLSME